MSKYSEFIKRPLTEILKKVSWEISCLDAGFTTVYVLGYVLDSAFLQITGALEQKVKCIYWELGNNNYELRYDILKNKIGECSNYEDKNKVFKMIIKEIIKLNKDVEVNQKDCWNSKINSFMNDFYNNNWHISEFYKKEYDELNNLKIVDFVKNCKYITKDFIDKIEFAEEIEIPLLNKVASQKQNNKRYLLNIIYNKAIEYRNRIAHNTKSTLNSLPDFAILRDENYKYENLFARFAIMLLVDRTFVDIFEQYEKARDGL
jgi:hypothetical protein